MCQTPALSGQLLHLDDGLVVLLVILVLWVYKPRALTPYGQHWHWTHRTGEIALKLAHRYIACHRTLEPGQVVHISQNCPFHTKMDLVRLHRKAPASFDLWAHYEHRKLTSPKWAHTRNHTVFGNNLTLHENLEIGMKTYGTLSTEELDALRMTRGHRNTTGF